MKSFIILLITFFVSIVSNGQTLQEAKRALVTINSLGQIDELKNQYPTWTIYEDKTVYSDSSKFPDIIKANVGDVVLKQFNPNAPTFVIKILTETEEELCKLKYIYLSGNKLSKLQIDSLRTIIINRYKNGTDFEMLAKKYTMDKNPTGDLDWFSKGMMVEEFDKAVRYRKKGEIFTVDVTNKDWFYVVLKTHDNKMEKAKVAVMIKYNM